MITITFLVLAFAITGHAGMWEKYTTLGKKKIKPNAQYKLATSGWSVRVYEWTPAYNPNWRCLFVGGTQKGGGGCYPVQQKLKIKYSKDTEE